MRIRILVRLWSHQKLNFYMKNNLNYVKKHTYEGTKAFLKRQETRLICKFWAISKLLDPDTAFLIRSWIQDSKMKVDPCGTGFTTLVHYMIMGNGISELITLSFSRIWAAWLPVRKVVPGAAAAALFAIFIHPLWNYSKLESILFFIRIRILFWLSANPDQDPCFRTE